jgi:polygalacturonase
MKYTLLFLVLSLVCCKSQKNKSTIEDQKNSNRMSQVSVKDFGAIGNGKRDDTQSFQKAVNYAILNGISDIIIEEGTYLLESVDVTEGLRFYGQDGAVLLKKPNSPKFSRMFKT